jgi:hypothetical protein
MEASVKQYELSYELPHSGVCGIHKEVIGAAAETDARAILRAKFCGQEVRIISGRQTSFGGGRDDGRRDGGR